MGRRKVTKEATKKQEQFKEVVDVRHVQRLWIST